MSSLVWSWFMSSIPKFLYIWGFFFVAKISTRPKIVTWNVPGNSAGDLFGMVSSRDPFKGESWLSTIGDKKVTNWITWFQLLPSDPFGCFKWPFQGLSDLHLGDQKVTWKKLVVGFSWVLRAAVFLLPWKSSRPSKVPFVPWNCLMK